MTINLSELADFGWKSFFTSQLETSDFDRFQPVRVTAVHRNALEITGMHAETTIPPFFAEDEEDRATVGDWLLLALVPVAGAGIALLTARMTVMASLGKMP